MKDGIFAVAALAVFLRICLAIMQAMAVRTADFRYIAYADRLSPLLNLMTLILVEVIALILFFAFREKAEYKNFIQILFCKTIDCSGIAWDYSPLYFPDRHGYSANLQRRLGAWIACCPSA